MTEIERCALMGDRDAQKECTKKGIVLPCPFCGTASELDEETGMLYHAYITGCMISGAFFPLQKWNTRITPPIGRREECEHWYKSHCTTGPCAAEETDADFCCRNFKSKEHKE